MNTLLVICVLASLPMTMSINCYMCLPGTTGCNDPFNANGAGVSQSSNGTYAYCMKVVAAGIATRSGEATCVSTPIVFNTGVACCQTDLCNAASSNYQMPILMVVGLVSMLAKAYWI